MPLTKYDITEVRVHRDTTSKSGWTACADVTISWDCVPPQDGDGDVDYDAEIREWVHHWLNERLP
jgi:hypothetical protein